MPRIICRSCGREIYTTAPIEQLFADERRCSIWGAADAAGIRFVGGHPMAGREMAGYGNAVGDLFVGRPWVLVGGALADVAAIERVAWVVAACGARPVRMDAATHD